MHSQNRRVAILGYGAIGRSIVRRLNEYPVEGVQLSALVTRKEQLFDSQERIPPNVVVTHDALEMLATRPDIVVEAASHEAVAAYGSQILGQGCELFLLSVGALANESLNSCLLAQARRRGGRIVIPSGALAGFDGLLALRSVGLTAVTYRATKPVLAWKGTHAEKLCDLDGLRHCEVFFSGSAREAALSFPKNANLAVAVALASLGLDNTKVELAADPNTLVNTGGLFAEADGARLELKLTGHGFSSNPKSSRVTGMSVVAALANRSALITYQ